MSKFLKHIAIAIIIIASCLTLEQILTQNTNSQKLMDASGSSKTWGYITLAAGLILTGNALYETGICYNYYEGSPFTSHQNIYGSIYDPKLFILNTILALGSDIVGTILLFDSKSQFYRAIKAYNNQYIASNFEYKIYINNNRLGLLVVFN